MTAGELNRLRDSGWDLRALPTHPPGEHAHHLHAIDLADAERIIRNLVHGQHYMVVACECEKGTA